jgi:hypothetical protein
LNRNSLKYPCLAIESEELNKNERLTKALDFQGFPTLKIVNKDGKIMGDYKGDRDITSLLDTVCKVYHHCMK